MLRIRQRGKYWHIRGTVRVGTEVREIKERSTGLREKTVAETFRVRLEKEIQDELLYGRAGRSSKVTFAEVGQTYIDRPGKTTGWMCHLPRMIIAQRRKPQFACVVTVFEK